jgi:hypothetical protein
MVRKSLSPSSGRAAKVGSMAKFQTCDEEVPPGSGRYIHLLL